MVTQAISHMDGTGHGIIGWGVVWALAYLVIASLLYLATLATFDRRIGRIPEKWDAGSPIFDAPSRRELLAFPVTTEVGGEPGTALGRIGE